jgi:hypothetical protein
MIIFPKRDVIPIIVPQICFKDRYNNMNNYAEMNPSIFIEEDGTTTIFKFGILFIEGENNR